MPNVDLTHADFDFGASKLANPRGLAVTAAGGNPDKAAEAVHLSTATAVPAPVIHQDLDGFKAKVNAATAGDIVNGNPQLRQYVSSNPMKAKVSSDDLGNLDDYSKAASAVPKGSFLQSLKNDWENIKAAGTAFRGAFAQDMDFATQSAESEKLINLYQNPLWKAYATAGLVPAAGAVELATKLPGALIGAVGAGLGQLTADNPEAGYSIAQDVGVVAMMADPAVGGMPHVPPELNALAAKARKVVDPIRKQESTEAVAKIKEAFSAAQSSATRERVPEFFKDFAEQHHGDDTIGISPEVVDALYGDKVPEEGDNLLGFVPDMAQQLEAARATGVDVKVPLADMMTHMDPEVFKQIEEGIRPSPDGFTKLEEPTPTPTQVFTDPAAVDMTKDHWRQYQEAIEAQQEAEREANLKRAVAEEKRRQAPEWEAKRKDMRGEVIDDFKEIPRFQVDQGIRGGDVPKLASDALTDAQKAVFPRSYFEKNGMLPDRLASFFGYDSGAAMLDDLERLHQNRGKTQPDEWVRKLIDGETARRMEAKHGNLAENILAAAKEQAYGPTVLDTMHAEIEALAADQGLAMPFSRGQIEAGARVQISGMKLASISSDDILRGIGRINRRIEDALLKGDAQAAFAERQRKFIATVAAKEAARIEGLKAKFDKIAKRYTGEVSGRLPEYTDAIQSVLSRLGIRTGRLEFNMEESLKKNGYSGLDDFVGKKFALFGSDIPKPEWLDSGFRQKVGDLTGSQFEDLQRFMAVMDHYAREENKVIVNGQKMDKAEAMAIIQRTLEERGPAKTLGPSTRERKTTLRSKIAHIDWEHKILETGWDSLDRWNPEGFFNQTFVWLLTEAAHRLGDLGDTFAARVTKSFEEFGDPSTKIKNDLWRDPKTGATFEMNRGHLGKILANVGNQSNRLRLFTPYGIDEATGMRWLWDRLAEDPLGYAGAVKWAQGLGKVFDDLHYMADNMSRQLRGEGIDKLPIDGVTGLAGEHIEGWYHPVDRDGIFDNSLLKRTEKSLFHEGYYRASTAQGHWKARAEDFAGSPLDLSLNNIPATVRQMVHDIAMRPAVVHLGKFFYDEKFRDLISRHYSEAFVDQLIPTLENIANSPNKTEMDSKLWKVIGGLTDRTVNTMIAFNIGTTLKHGLTAMAKNFAMMPVGFSKEMVNLLRTDPTTSQRGWQLAMEKSDECQRRFRTFEDYANNVIGTNIDIPKHGLLGALNKTGVWFKHAGTWPIAMFDLLSSTAYFNAIYKAEIAKGNSEGMAKFIADKGVRQTHGSSLITNKPMITQSRNPIVASFARFYTFFNENLQMQHKAVAQLMDTGRVYDKEGFRAAAENVGKSARLGFLSMILPGLIEQAVAGDIDKKASWLGTVGKSIAGSIGGGYLFVRDMVNALIHGVTPEGGLMSAVYKTLSDPAKDLLSHKHMTKQGEGKLIKDTMTLGGLAIPGLGLQAGRTAQFIHGVATRQEHPRSALDWAGGLWHGTLKERRK